MTLSTLQVKPTCSGEQVDRCLGSFSRRNPHFCRLKELSDLDRDVLTRLKCRETGCVLGRIDLLVPGQAQVVIGGPSVYPYPSSRTPSVDDHRVFVVDGARWRDRGMADGEDEGSQEWKWHCRHDERQECSMRFQRVWRCLCYCFVITRTCMTNKQIHLLLLLLLTNHFLTLTY